MAGSLLRSSLLAAAAVAAGFAGGWVAGRASIPAPPPPPSFVNPFARVKVGESLVLKLMGGSQLQQFRVLEVDDQTVLLSVETLPLGGTPSRMQMRVARTFWGAFIIIEGDVDPQAAMATAKDFTMESATPDDLYVEPLHRTFHCWKVTGRHRVLLEMTYWITDELPVHGVLRIDTTRGKVWEVDAMSGGEK